MPGKVERGLGGEGVPVEWVSKSGFGTTSRFLAAVVNEGLAVAVVAQPAKGNSLGLRISSNEAPHQSTSASIWVGLDGRLPYDAIKMRLLRLLHPDDLRPPVYLGGDASPAPEGVTEVDPNTVFTTMCQWLGSNEGARRQIIEELNSSVVNQEAPLAAIAPNEILQMMKPEIIFISVMRSDIRIVGPFESSIEPLLRSQGVELAENTSERIVLPCLARQLPAIRHHLRSGISQLPSTPLFGQAQASIRTVSLSPNHNFPYDLKFALACNITSALRTITPWTALVGPEICSILEKLMPRSMWICKEHAAVTGAQTDFDDAKHCSVLLRENLQRKADAQGESLIISAALAERGVEGEACHAERLFELSTLEQKQHWFREYAALILATILPPVLNHGIGIEAHCQNLLARFDIKSKALTGFAMRDLGGFTMHMPTLRSQGFDITTSPPGSSIPVDDLQKVWYRVHHSLFQGHLNQMIHGLKLQRRNGWAIVREELYKILKPDSSGEAKAFYNFLMAESMPMKCFLGMKMQRLYRDTDVSTDYWCVVALLMEILDTLSRCTQCTFE
ncbi:MAG: hypothetical protein Q9191_000968 [Dirinaria sp. TL-2023a]